LQIKKLALPLSQHLPITITDMTTAQRIAELTQVVNPADTTIATGRESVANACKELYNLIEQDVYNADKEWMLKGMYNDLCNGNFCEPFYCELKKTEFKPINNYRHDNSRNL